MQPSAHSPLSILLDRSCPFVSDTPALPLETQEDGRKPAQEGCVHGLPFMRLFRPTLALPFVSALQPPSPPPSTPPSFYLHSRNAAPSTRPFPCVYQTASVICPFVPQTLAAALTFPLSWATPSSFPTYLPQTSPNSSASPNALLCPQGCLSREALQATDHSAPPASWESCPTKSSLSAARRSWPTVRLRLPPLRIVLVSLTP